MARLKTAENTRDPATGKPLPAGVTHLGPSRYRARKLIEGKRHSEIFEKAKLAKNWIDDKSAQVRAGTHVDRRSLANSTVTELVTRYEESEMQAGGRRRGSAEDLGHTPSLKLDEIGSLTLSKLTPARVREFRERQEAAGYAKSTIVKRMNLLAAIIQHGRSEWDIPMAENPASAQSVKRPAGADKKRTRRLMRVSPAALRDAAARGEDPPKGEEERLLAAVALSEWPADRYLVRWSIAQATRQGEALELRWRDVDFDAKTFVVRGRGGRGTKSDAHREERGHEIRPLVLEAIAILKEMVPEGGAKPDDVVFDVGPAYAFRVRFGRFTRRAGLADLTFHDLRHEATSRLAKRYPNPSDLKRVTGHADLKSLDRYYQPDLTELAEKTDVRLMPVREVLEAWQAGEVTEAWAMRQTSAETKSALCDLARQCGVEVRVGANTGSQAAT